jgi:arylsulfatase A-like enzyme
VARLILQLRVALSVGAVGGLLLGSREALLALQANAFVQPGQYFWLYLAVPVLAWIALGIVLLVPVAVLIWALRLERRWGGPWALHAAALAAMGASSIAIPWLATTIERLRDVGSGPTVATRLGLWMLVAGLVAAAVLLAGGAASAYAARTSRPLRQATRGALLVALVLTWPVVRFVRSDWMSATSSETPASPGRHAPNILLLSIDTLRADHLGAYGGSPGLTPHLDRFATEGIVFERAITSSPWTLPAMASLMTGLHPRHHGAGVITNRRDPLGRAALPTGSWTLAKSLREHGYQTQAIVTNPYLALRYGFGQGFDGYENVTIESEAFLAFADTTAVRLLTWLRPEVIVGDRGETVSARVRDWLARRDGVQPFLLWVHYIDPHPPYSRPGVTHHKSFRGDTSFLPANPSQAGAAMTTSPDVARLRSGEIRLGPEEKEAVRQLYRAEVAGVDAAVGSVLEAIDEMRLRDRTLVVVVADHGEEFWEHGGVEHGHTVYDELVRVPLLARWPARLAAGVRVAEVARMVDIAPTILELLGLTAPAEMDGQSLVGLIRGQDEPPRVALIENLLFAEERVGIRGAQHKYVRWQTGKEEVYDLGVDPGELRDLAAIDTVSQPLRQLYAIFDQNPMMHSVPKREPELDAAAEAALRALGYIR